MGHPPPVQVPLEAAQRVALYCAHCAPLAVAEEFLSEAALLVGEASSSSAGAGGDEAAAPGGTTDVMFARLATFSLQVRRSAPRRRELRSFIFWGALRALAACGVDHRINTPACGMQAGSANGRAVDPARPPPLQLDRSSIASARSHGNSALWASPSPSSALGALPSGDDFVRHPSGAAMSSFRSIDSQDGSRFAGLSSGGGSVTPAAAAHVRRPSLAQTSGLATSGRSGHERCARSTAPRHPSSSSSAGRQSSSSARLCSLILRVLARSGPHLKAAWPLARRPFPAALADYVA